jgi:beta-glucanase (GH16 family)
MKFICLFFLVAVLAGQHTAAQSTPYRGGSGTFKKLVWADEFSGSGGPDTAKWGFEKGYVRNKELQYYTEGRLQNAEVKNGVLHITARNDSMRTGAEVNPITSASLITKGKAAWTYGRIEVRAKLPSSLGTWPAIWMLGSDIDTTGWPACGEIDIMEHVGYMPDTVHFNVHMQASVKGTSGRKINNSMRIFHKAPHTDYHVYAIEWFPDRLDWYFDQKKVFTYANDGGGEATWPFSKPQYLILNLAFGGGWGGQRGVDLKSLPQTFLVDYVMVYK